MAVQHIGSSEFVFEGYAYPGETYDYNLNVNEIERIAMQNICRDPLITNNTGGEICFATLECPEDIFVYNVPPNGTGSLIIDWQFNYPPYPGDVVFNIQLSNCNLNAPTLISPANGVEHQDTNKIFKWLSIVGATSYDLQVSTTEDFSSIVYQTNIPGTQKYVTGLDYNTTYFWRVKAKNNNCPDAEWSEPWSYTTCELVAPLLTAPLHNVTEQALTEVKLKWGTVPSASSYMLQIDTVNDFSSNYFVTEQPLPEFTIPVLAKNTSYYWRVKAINANCDGPWSEAWKFTTKIGVNLSRNIIENDEVIPVAEIVPAPPGTFDYFVVADGTATLSLGRNRGKLSIATSGNEAKVGKLQTEFDQGQWITTYTAPREFDPQNHIVFLYYQHDQAAILPDLVIKLTIRPTPVILLHGLTSNAAMWTDVKGALLTRGWTEEDIITPEYQNDASFATQTGVIDLAMSNILSSLRSGKTFINKVTLIGHSMGGLVSRQYLADNSGTKNVYKLITINTPHTGSEFANFVMNGDKDGIGADLAKVMFEGTPNNVGGTFGLNNGALSCLKTDSDEITNLNSAPTADVPVHAICSDFTACDYATPDKQPLALVVTALNNFLLFAYITVNTGCLVLETLLGDENDGVVRLESQKGGLTGSTTQTYVGPTLKETHVGIYTNPAVTEDHLPLLLYADPQNALFQQGGFSPFAATDPIAYRPAPPPSDANVEIEVTNLQDGDTIYAASNPHLVIVGQSGVTGIMIMYHFNGATHDSLVWDAYPSNSQTFGIPILPGYQGFMHVGVMGTNGLGDLDYDPLDLYVVSASGVAETGLQANPVVISPNPTRGELHIECKDWVPDHIQLSDALGREILSMKPDNSVTNLNLGQQQTGLYYLRLTAGTNTLVRKVILER